MTARVVLLAVSLWMAAVGAWGTDFGGRVASATDDTPLAGATVRLLSLPDSTMIVGGYADAEGRFTLQTTRLKAPAASGKGTGARVALQFTYIGYQPTWKVVTLRRREQTYDLGDVYMQEEQRILGEAIVSATPPPLVVREDTIEYYADSYATQPGATAEDLLKRLPGVEVNDDGTITAQGETVEQIYVDGREFFGRNTQVTTRNLTADMLESVQVVDMQTEESRLSGIDNGERRKVINLKLKPKMRRGWFGNAAGAYGPGHDIDDRWDTKAMVGYFRGRSQNAAVASGNNTGNAAFGDLGDGVLRGSSLRSGRQSGRRGDGLNTSWSTGVNIGYDEGNRMRDVQSPRALGGDVLYGGSSQTEQSRSHRVNYLTTGSTESDNLNHGDNTSHNVQANLKAERSWGRVEDGLHHVEIRPELAYNKTETADWSRSATYHGLDADADPGAAPDTTYISQTERTSDIRQWGLNGRLALSYGYTHKTDRGRRRSTATVTLSGRLMDGDNYTRSYTSYDTRRVDDLAQQHDTLIDQWRTEDSHSGDLSLRLTHIEPLAPHHALELSARATYSSRTARQIYHFWDAEAGLYTDSVGDRSNLDYSSDTRTRQANYTLSAAYRMTTERTNVSAGIDLLPQRQHYTDLYDHERDYTRRYMNVAPRVEYRYNWDRRHNLRVTLGGQTQQPSQSQLQARKNQTSATHVTLGNPDLDPSMRWDLRANYRATNPETFTSVDAGLTASANFNALSTKRWYSENLRTDTTMTVNIGGLSGWNVRGNFRGSYPWGDNRWYATTEVTGGYQESVGYANLRSTDTQLNRTRTASTSEALGIAYRSEPLTIELRATYSMQHTEATVVTSGTLGTTRHYGLRGHANVRLPWRLTMQTSCTYTARRGYAAGVTRNQTIWNAELSRTFLRQQNLSAFVKAYDLLRERSAISRTVSTTSMVDRESTTLGQFFLAGLSLRFGHMGRRGGRQQGGGGEARPSRPSDGGRAPQGGGRR